MMLCPIWRDNNKKNKIPNNKMKSIIMSTLLIVALLSLGNVDAFTTLPQQQQRVPSRLSKISTTTATTLATSNSWRGKLERNEKRNDFALHATFDRHETNKDDMNDDDDDNDDDVLISQTVGKSLSLKHRLIRRLKPVALAFLTAATFNNLKNLQNSPPSNMWKNAPHLLTTPPPALASGPIMPIRKRVYEDPMVVAKKKAAEYRRKRDQAKSKDYLNELSNIESTQGKAAAEKFEQEREAQKTAELRQKELDRPKLIKSLMEQGLCPFTDSEGVRQLFLFDEEYDLAKVADTEQSIEAIMKKQNPTKYEQEKSHARFIVKCIVEDLKLKGEDYVEYFQTHQENTRKIYQMRPQDAKKMAEAYKTVIERQGSLTAPDVIKKIRAEKGLPEDPAEDAKLEAEKEAAAEKAAAAAVATSSSGDKDAAKAAKAKARAEAREAKLQRRAARAEARTQRRAARAEAKAEKQAAKAEANAAKKKAADAAKTAVAAGAAATAAAGSAAATATTAAAASSKASIADAAKAARHPAADSEIAATSGMEFAATAGQEAVSRSALESGETKADSSSSTAVEKSEAKTSSSSSKTAVAKKKNSLNIVKASAVVALGGGGAFAYKTMRDKAAEEEAERQRQFKLIMGLDEDDDEDDDDDDDAGTIADDWMMGGGSETKKVEPEKKKKPAASAAAAAASAASTELPKKKKKRGGIASMFSKAGDNRETDIAELLKPDAEAPEFALLLAKILTYGAPGRFPYITAQPGGMPFEEETATGEEGDEKTGGFDLDKAKIMLMESRISKGLTDQASAELFASVVNCMIIDIIDLASSSLKEKKDKNTVAALNVVMDFMDHAASLFDAVAEGVTITPVTYSGTLAKGKLEQMFGIYAGSALGLEGATQDRIDTLQQVFSITDKKAEGLVQKTMMKNLMKMMKDGGEGMEGMEGMGDLLGAMGGGAGGLEGMGGGLPGMDGDISPEEVKQSVSMMKELMESGQISKEEIAEVRKQFEQMYGSDIKDLIKAADEEGAAEELGEDGKELLDLFKAMLKDE